MKKFLMTLMASMLLLSSTTYAVEVSKAHNPAKQMITMSKADALDMLKDAGIEAGKVKMLDNGEMVQTEGEWLGAALALFAIGFVKAANAPTSPNQPAAWSQNNGYPHQYSTPGIGYIWGW